MTETITHTFTFESSEVKKALIDYLLLQGGCTIDFTQSHVNWAVRNSFDTFEVDAIVVTAEPIQPPPPPMPPCAIRDESGRFCTLRDGHKQPHEYYTPLPPEPPCNMVLTTGGNERCMRPRGHAGFHDSGRVKSGGL